MKTYYKTLVVIILILLKNQFIYPQWVQTASTGSGKVTSLVVNGSNLFAGTKPGGVYLSTNDGTSWAQVNNGISITDINALGVNGTVIYSAAAPFVYSTANNGANWSDVNVPMVTDYNCFAFNGNNIFVGGSGVAISTNNGTNWSFIQMGSGMDTATAYALAINGTNLFAGTVSGISGGGIFLSTNNGTNWTKCFSGKYIFALAVSGSNIFAGTWGSGIYLSTNNGTNWTQVNNGLTSLYVYSFAVSGSSLFAGTNNGIYLSNDNGTTWTQVGLTGNYVFSLVISGTNIFAGTSTAGVWRRPLSDLTLPVELSTFVSTIQERNILLNWSTQTEKNSDKFNIERKTIGVDWGTIGSVKAAVLSNSPKQYSFTDKNLQAGKYQYRLKMIDNDGTFEYSKVIETEVALPKSFDLKQNYPNPFNPTTKIEYMLPSNGHVKLMVYDIKGALIKVLVNEYKDAGYYETEFNAKGLASGIYIYRIEVIGEGNSTVYSDMKKTVLLK